MPGSASFPLEVFPSYFFSRKTVEIVDAPVCLCGSFKCHNLMRGALVTGDMGEVWR